MFVFIYILYAKTQLLWDWPIYWDVTDVLRCDKPWIHLLFSRTIIQCQSERKYTRRYIDLRFLGYWPAAKTLAMPCCRQLASLVKFLIMEENYIDVSTKLDISDTYLFCFSCSREKIKKSVVGWGADASDRNGVSRSKWCCIIQRWNQI